MVSPQAARELALWTLPSLGTGIDALRALVHQGPEASFLAELELTGERGAKPLLQVHWRATGHRSLPQVKGLAPGRPHASEGDTAGLQEARVLFKARWSELDGAWRQRVARSLRAKAPPSRLRMANPSAHGVEIELFGLADPSMAAALVPRRAQAAGALAVELREALLSPQSPAATGDA